MRDTIQLLLFDPTVQGAGPKLADTIPFEGVTQREHGDPLTEVRLAALPAVATFPSGHALPEVTTKRSRAEVISLRLPRDQEFTGPKAA